KELQELELRVKKARATAQDRSRVELRKKIEAMVADAGFKLSDLFGGRGGKGRTVAAKYVNPDDPSETWTGRGRKHSRGEMQQCEPGRQQDQHARPWDDGQIEQAHVTEFGARRAALSFRDGKQRDAWSNELDQREQGNPSDPRGDAPRDCRHTLGRHSQPGR
ncbi:H-NS histone family protein, partial [Lacticaseibacillus rhamnosus]